MAPLTDKELYFAYWFWYRDYPYWDTESAIDPFLTINPSRGWLRKARQALFLSTGMLAKRMQISRSAYTQLEQSEDKGRLTLQKLEQAAAAMNCEVIYAIRPKQKTRFSKIIWAQILPTARQHHWLNRCDQKRRANGLAAVAKFAMENPDFRRRHDWSQR